MALQFTLFLMALIASISHSVHASNTTATSRPTPALTTTVPAIITGTTTVPAITTGTTTVTATTTTAAATTTGTTTVKSITAGTTTVTEKTTATITVTTATTATTEPNKSYVSSTTIVSNLNVTAMSNSTFTPTHTPTLLSIGAIAGIVLGVVVIIAITVFFLIRQFHKKHRSLHPSEGMGDRAQKSDDPNPPEDQHNITARD